MKELKYSDNGINFQSVKLPQTLFKEGPLGIVPSNTGDNSEGSKGITYNGEEITSVTPFINAVDIDWNDAQVNGESLKTTGQLLNIISSKVDENSFKTINGEPIIGEGDILINGGSGNQGPQGEQGEQGEQGKSAYEIAVENGFSGTQSEWLEALKGDSAYEIYKNNVEAEETILNKEEWLNSLYGKSAYEIAVNHGFEGTEEEWLESLKGEPGSGSGSGSGEENIIEQINLNGTKLEPIDKTVEINLKTLKFTDGLQDQTLYVKGGLNYIQLAKVASTGDYRDLKNRPDSSQYTKIFRKSTINNANNTKTDLDSIQRIVYKTDELNNEESQGTEQSDSENNKYAQNQVHGYHSVALGFGNEIGNNEGKGNYSLTEGKWTKVYGNFSHAAGLSSTVYGDYSSNGGFNISLREDVKKNAINGNYSFGYGRNLQTFNNGEVAFGNYNKSTTISQLRRPSNGEELAYDNHGNPWKIIDFYNISLNFETDEFETIIDQEGYAYGYDSEDDSSEQSSQELSQSYSTFIGNVVAKNCKILENLEISSVEKFCSTIIHYVNLYKSLYTYEYGNVDHSNINSRCIVGVIAQKINSTTLEPLLDNENNPIYDFFVWGPNSLYYKPNENESPITMFSIGNGYPLMLYANSEEGRQNLVEVTNDGNIYYSNGKSNLFDIEDEITDIKNTLGLIPSETELGVDDSDPSDITGTITISKESPQLQVITNTTAESYYINISSSNQQESFKRTIILNSNCFDSNDNNFLIFNLDYDESTQQYNNQNLHINANLATNWNIDSNNKNYLETNVVSGLLKIDIEIINNICLVTLYEYENAVNVGE